MLALVHLAASFPTKDVKHVWFLCQALVFPFQIEEEFFHASLQPTSGLVYEGWLKTKQNKKNPVFIAID